VLGNVRPPELLKIFYGFDVKQLTCGRWKLPLNDALGAYGRAVNSCCGCAMIKPLASAVILIAAVVVYHVNADISCARKANGPQIGGAILIAGCDRHNHPQDLVADRELHVRMSDIARFSN
jgi:hypothetical protein